MNMNKIYVLGEALIDYIKNDKNEYEACVGGASLNASIYSAKNKETYLLTCLSRDSLTKQIVDTLRKHNVKTNFIECNLYSKTCYTKTITNDLGENQFIFSSDCASFKYYNPANIDLINLNEGDIVYLGSVSLISKIMILCHERIIKKAKENKAIIAFDPNYRSNIFPKPKKFLKTINFILKECNIIKLNEDELTLIFKDLSIPQIFKKYPNLKLILLTKGDKGSEVYSRTKTLITEGIKVNVKDTIGCGDAYFGTFLSLIPNLKIEELSDYDYSEINKKATLVSSKVASISGAILNED